MSDEAKASVARKFKIYLAKMCAMDAHSKQKYGKHPYQYHLDGVVENIKKFDINDEKKDHCCVVGYLYDTLEDTDITEEEISIKFGETVLRDVRALTKPKGKFYPEYIESLLKEASEEALLVKLADLEFNMEHSERRMKDENRNFKHMFEKYGLAKMLITKHMRENYGNRIL